MVQDHGRQKHRGLVVGTLLAQNISLLTKWQWRLKNEQGLLWVEVIDCIHNLKSHPSDYLGSKGVFR